MYGQKTKKVTHYKNQQARTLIVLMLHATPLLTNLKTQTKGITISIKKIEKVLFVKKMCIY